MWSTLLWLLILLGLTYYPYKILGIDAEESKILCLEQDCRFWIFFYIGMVIQKYNLIRFIQSKWVFFVSCVLYYLMCIFGFDIASVFGVVGIIYMVSLSYQISLKMPTLFSSYSKYTYQIYLLHMLPIMAVKFVYHRNIMPDVVWFPLCWVVALLCAIYIPTIVARMAEKCPKNVRVLIGL